MNIKKHIPNAITCLNLLSGAMAVLYMLHEENTEVAVWLIIAAAIFDFFDGLVARALGVSSPIGKDLDSLADVISFGLAPSVVLLNGLWDRGVPFEAALPSLLIAAFAALRLAKFNNDTRQSLSFIGLPVPANAFFWIGLTLALPDFELMLGPDLMLAVVYILIGLFCFFMVSEIPMFSFKMGGGKDKKEGVAKSSFLLSPQGLLVLLSIIALVLFALKGLSLIIVAYILLSLFHKSK